jgi:hypothetical protein
MTEAGDPVGPAGVMPRESRASGHNELYLRANASPCLDSVVTGSSAFADDDRGKC